MSIFGMLDAANIPSNPFWIEEGEYPAQITKALYKNNRDGQRQLVIEYTVTDEDSQFNDQTATHYFNLVDKDMTAEKFALLPSDEQQKIRRINSSIKKTLCGNSQHKGLNVDVNDLNDPDWKPEVLLGIDVTLAISNYGANNEGVNIKWVNVVTE